MIDRKINVTNPFTGKVTEETYWFHLSTSDALDMQLLERDDVQEYLKSILEGEDGIRMMRIMKDMAFQAVGRREGDRFVKRGVREEFIESGAWDSLFDELMQLPDGGMESFFLKILPKEMQEKAAAQAAKEYTNVELLEMSDEDFYKAAGTHKVEDMDKRFVLLAYERKSNKRMSA